MIVKFNIIKIRLFYDSKKKVVNHNLHTTVATSDLGYDVKENNFYFCLIESTTRASVKLTSKSNLYQSYDWFC